MLSGESRFSRLALVGLPLFVLAASVLLRHAPGDVTTILTIWATASLPIGIAIGHLALGEG